jgi:hypothetical protein
VTLLIDKKGRVSLKAMTLSNFISLKLAANCLLRPGFCPVFFVAIVDPGSNGFHLYNIFTTYKNKRKIQFSLLLLLPTSTGLISSTSTLRKQLELA